MKAIHRSMACMMAAVVCSGLLAAPGQAQEPGTKAKLLYQALNVFQRHCLKCHGDAAKGGVRILDRTLLVEQRQVVHPLSPENSELFDLVQGGSMPPGNSPKVPQNEIDCLREWIQSGAETLPSTHDESYVLWSIVCDLRTMTDEQKRSSRYLSLNHSRNLVGQRETLERVLRNLVPPGKQPPSLRPIEPTNSVFRIDLKELGWDRHPYPEEEEKRWRSLNLFDLILLEYPHGRLPTGSPFYRDGVLPFLLLLQEAGQVRPIPYVRADWLAEAIAQPPLHADFLRVLGNPPNSKPIPGSLTRPDALGDTNGGLPIVPLDGLTYPAKPNADIRFRAIDFQQRNLANPPAKDPFVPGDRMALWIKSKGNAIAEVIHTNLKDGRKSKPSGQESFECEAGKATWLSPEGGIRMELDPKEEQDIEEYSIFAYPREELNATDSLFPKGTLLRAEGIHDRVVHPLYRVRPDGRGFEPPDPGKMVKVTITITTKRKKD